MIIAREEEIVRLVRNWRNYGEAMLLARDMALDMDEAIERVQKKKDLGRLAWMEITETYPEIKRDSEAGIGWNIKQGLWGRVILRPPKVSESPPAP